ncbi:MAG: aminotransferase [Gammaproteobacteria bacterium]|nr:aminotransferase [Gammaproteobacteria bacterium]
MFNPDVANLDTPAIPLALSWIDAYQQQYGSLLDLSQAVPNYPPPQAILDSLARHAGSTQSTGYGSIEGEPLLRERYANLVNRQYTAGIQPDHVHITSGCNQAFVAALMTLARSGDRVVMTNPCYFNHEATARMLGLATGYISCHEKNRFLPTIEAVEASLDENTRVLALVSPNNPTGAIYPPDLLESIFLLCQQRGVWLLLDETYRDFLPTDGPPHSLLQRPGWENTFVQLYSFSKSLCIPGHRVGALVGGKEMVTNVAKVMDNLQICAPRAAQLTVAEQLPKLDEWRRGNQQKINTRSAVFQDVIGGFTQWKIASIGAYFAYVRQPTDTSAVEVARHMAQEFGVLCLPGSFFGTGQERYLRMAFANADTTTLLELKGRFTAMSGHPFFSRSTAEA